MNKKRAMARNILILKFHKKENSHPKIFQALRQKYYVGPKLCGIKHTVKHIGNLCENVQI